MLDPMRLVVSQMLRQGMRGGLVLPLLEAAARCPMSPRARRQARLPLSPWNPGNRAPGRREGVIQNVRLGLEGLGRLLLPLRAGSLSRGGGFQMPCSSSRSFRSRDHLSPLSSAAPLCRDSLSDLRGDRDTWLT